MMSAITGAMLTAIDSPSGLQGSGISIFPNPSPGIFNIQGPDSYRSDVETSISIFNAFGEEVYINELNLPARVDLSTQPGGIYFVRIETGNNVFFEKLVIN